MDAVEEVWVWELGVLLGKLTTSTLLERGDQQVPIFTAEGVLKCC